MKKLFPLFLLLAVSAFAQTNEPAAVPITLTWTPGDGTPPDATYKMYMKAGTNDWAPVMTTTNIVMTLILKPADYQFRVTCLGFWGETPPSNVYSIPAPGPQNAPKDLKAQLGVPNKPDQ